MSDWGLTSRDKEPLVDVGLRRTWPYVLTERYGRCVHRRVFLSRRKSVDALEGARLNALSVAAHAEVEAVAARLIAAELVRR